jgi:AcrR family transcriptional regulator
MELFARHGYRGTGMAAIAEQAGVPLSSITYYFGTKERLLQAVLEEMDRQALAQLDDDHRPGIEAAFERLLRDAEHMLAAPNLLALHTTLTAENLTPDGPMHAYFQHRNRQLRRHLADALRYSAERRTIRTDVDPDVKAAEIAAFLEGAAIQWLLDPGQADLTALYRSYIDAQLASLRADEAAQP